MPHKKIALTDHSHSLTETDIAEIQVKIDKLVAHHPKATENQQIHLVVFNERKRYSLTGEINIRGHKIVAHEESHEANNFHVTFDRLIAALERQLQKHKDKDHARATSLKDSHFDPEHINKRLHDTKIEIHQQEEKLKPKDDE